MPPQTDQSLVCPKCGEATKLTESLAAPLVAATRAEYERQLADQAKTFEMQKQTLNDQKAANDRRAVELEAAASKQQQEVAQAVRDQVATQLVTERKTIADQESARARQEVEDQLKAERDASTLQKERIETLTKKLTDAQATRPVCSRSNNSLRIRSANSNSICRKASLLGWLTLEQRRSPRHSPPSILKCRTVTTRSPIFSRKLTA